MRASKYDRRVTIVRAGGATRDDHGELVETSEDRTETWASVRPAPGTERFGSAENAATAPMRFVFRWRSGLVLVTDELEYDGRRFGIASVNEIGRRKELEVLATARGEG